MTSDRHGHESSRDADASYLGVALGLLAAFMVGEVVVAVTSHSLVLLADAGHMLTDAGALGLSIGAIRLARRPPTTQWTFGLKRAEVISAAVNGVVLVVVAIFVVVSAAERLVHPPAVHGVPIIVVALVGAVVNICATLVVARAERSNLSVRGAFAHLVSDLWAFVGTLLAGILIALTGYDRVDAIASLGVAAVITATAWRLIRESGRVLFEAAPADIDLDEVRAHLLAENHVVDVHDLHAWVVTSDLPSLSAHVVVDDSCFEDGHAPKILDDLQNCLAKHFSLAHSTFQLELPSHAEHEDQAH